jgi:hypothetical protein
MSWLCSPFKLIEYYLKYTWIIKTVLASSFVSLIFLKWNPKRIQFILRRKSHLCIFGTKITSIPSYHSTGFSDKFKHAFNLFNTWLNHTQRTDDKYVFSFYFPHYIYLIKHEGLNSFHLIIKKKKTLVNFTITHINRIYALIF